MNKNVNKEPVKWMKIKWIRVLKDKPESIFYKTSFEDPDFQEIHVGKKMNKLFEDNGSVFTQKYSDLLGVNVKKKNDLLKLCKDGVIPKDHHGFYENLKISDKSDVPNLSEEDF